MIFRLRGNAHAPLIYCLTSLTILLQYIDSREIRRVFSSFMVKLKKLKGVFDFGQILRGIFMAMDNGGIDVQLKYGVNELDGWIFGDRESDLV